MRTVILKIFLFTTYVSFGQLDTNEILEPVAYTKACLEAAIKPRPDTLECYPNATKHFTKLIDQYLVILRPKLKEEFRKEFESNQYIWEIQLKYSEYETNKILQDTKQPLFTRRQAVIRHFKLLETRALYLRKLIASA